MGDLDPARPEPEVVRAVSRARRSTPSWCAADPGPGYFNARQSGSRICGAPLRKRYALHRARDTPAHTKLLRRQSRDRAGVAGNFEDVQASIGAVDEIDVAAVVGFDIVALDR